MEKERESVRKCIPEVVGWSANLKLYALREKGVGREGEKNNISHAQLVSGRNWPVNKVARQTRDADTAGMAKSRILCFVRSV